MAPRVESGCVTAGNPITTVELGRDGLMRRGERRADETRGDALAGAHGGSVAEALAPHPGGPVLALLGQPHALRLSSS